MPRPAWMPPECGCHVAGFSATPHTLVLFSPHFPLAMDAQRAALAFGFRDFRADLARRFGLLGST
jgi:hypothetical protein